MICRHCGRATHQDGALVGMIGLGCLAAGVSEWASLGHDVAVVLCIVGAVGGFFLGWWGDIRANEAEDIRREAQKDDSVKP